MILSRPRQTRRLHARLEEPGPAIVLVEGARRAGKTTFLREALERLPLPDRHLLWYGASPLPDPDQRHLFRRTLETLLENAGAAAGGAWAGGTGGSGEAEWSDLLGALEAWIGHEREATVFVLDGWDRLTAAHRRIAEPLHVFWAEARRRDLPLHLVVASRPGPATDPFHDDGPLAPGVTDRIEVEPVDYREALEAAAPAAPGAREKLRFALVFGGRAPVLAALPRGASLKEALFEAVLETDAPLLRWGEELLEAQLQSPERYASVLGALSRGPAEWSEIRDAAPAFSSGAQIAPYLRRLEELGLATIHRSLDAGPRSRNRRYGVTDPFVAFWFRFILPHLGALERGEAEPVWNRAIRPHLDDHAARHFPQLCRRFLAAYGAQRWGVAAREVGGLWGSGYDLPVSGTLWSGAILYGTTAWEPSRADPRLMDEIARARGETRYGFGREARIRIAFTGCEAEPELLRLGARDPYVEVITPAELMG